MLSPTEVALDRIPELPGPRIYNALRRAELTKDPHFCEGRAKAREPPFRLPPRFHVSAWHIPCLQPARPPDEPRARGGTRWRHDSAATVTGVMVTTP